MILCEAAARLIDTRRESALLLLGLLEVDLCDFYPALLRLVIGQTVEALLLLLARCAGAGVRSAFPALFLALHRSGHHHMAVEPATASCAAAVLLRMG